MFPISWVSPPGTWRRGPQWPGWPRSCRRQCARVQVRSAKQQLILENWHFETWIMFGNWQVTKWDRSFAYFLNWITDEKSSLFQRMQHLWHFLNPTGWPRSYRKYILIITQPSQYSTDLRSFLGHLVRLWRPIFKTGYNKGTINWV